MLSKSRKKIDKLDLELQKLFAKRLELVKDIKEYKRKNNISVFDMDREKNLKKSLYLSYPNKDELKYYQKFLDNILQISKEYQND